MIVVNVMPSVFEFETVLETVPSDPVAAGKSDAMVDRCDVVITVEFQRRFVVKGSVTVLLLIVVLLLLIVEISLVKKSKFVFRSSEKPMLDEAVP